MTNETITNIANIALTASFIVALIFGIAQVKTAKRDRRERLTIEVLREFQTTGFVEVITYISTNDMPTTWTGLQNLPPKEQIMLVQLGQQMESLGIMVAEGIIKMDLVDKTPGSFVTTARNKCEAMFLDIREQQPDPFLAEYYQWLAEAID
ncbi:hypothetical protein [Mucilaginibacter sp.]|uniref:DUF4760 domain-containing protein n=1 Tax=Mucilaginibacter sp. TaxID=1882438 RepID=UPI00283B6B5E|nr:hypothetical protein [Mucilaginibacter sp.]MDR3696684.1 hypothetical protein [Mucilaginibacter sp.]